MTGAPCPASDSRPSVQSTLLRESIALLAASGREINCGPTVSAHPTNPSTLSCPSCKARFQAPRARGSGEARWYCLACRKQLSGAEEGPRRWLYPMLGEAPAPVKQITADTFDLTGATFGAPHGGEPPAPERRISRFELEGELGRGGMGVVYRVRDPALDRSVALKMLTGGAFASPQAQARFMEEARAAAALEHPGIVRVLEMGRIDDQPFFTMELVQGPSLEEILRRYGPLPAEEAARVGLQLARAIAFAHEAGIVHRDLKPGNLLLTGDGQARVTDFGLARSITTDRDLTATAQVLGTPAYMAPEAARAEPDIDWRRADQYGVGALIFAALTGRPPRGGASVAQALSEAMRGDSVSPRTHRPDLPPLLDAIVCVAMHPEPGRRYASVAALADDLEAFLDGEPVSARPEGWAERGRRALRRHRRASGLTLLVAAAVGAALLQGPLRDRRAEASREAAATADWASVSPRLEQAALEEAAAGLQAFAEAPEHRGTRAAAEAWLRYGDLLIAQPRPRGEVASRSMAHMAIWARALTESGDDRTRAAALLRMAGSALEEGQLRDLRALVDALEALPEGTVAPDELLPLALQVALYTGDQPRAIAAWDAASALGLPIARRIADPRRARRFLESAERVGEALAPTLIGAPELPEPGLLLLAPEDPSRAVLLGLRPEVRELGALALEVDHPNLAEVRWTDAGLVHRPGDRRTDRWGDLDGDGAPEGYRRSGLYLRGLSRLALTPAGYEERPAPIALDRVPSDITDLIIDDVDGDGQQELVLGLGAWWAYDLRVYAGGPEGLRLRARAHRNATHCLATLPDPWGDGRLIASCESNHYSNAATHGDERPEGPPSAVAVRRLEGDALVDVFAWTLPEGLDALHLLQADLDGDGREEIVGDLVAEDAAGLHYSIFALWAGAEAGEFSLSLIPGLKLVGAAELDGAPGEELLVAKKGPGPEHEVWIAGRGAGPLPARAGLAPQPEVPLLAGGADDTALQDAALLHSAGLTDQAAELLMRSATRTGRAVHALAAAALWQLSERPDQRGAALEFAAAGLSGALADEAWGRAIEAWLAAAAPDEALRVAERWRAAGGGPSGDLARRLEGWQRAGERTIQADLSREISPAWRVNAPLQLSLTGGQTRAHWLGVGQTLAELPLVREQAPFAATMALTVEHREWASGATLALYDRDTPLVTFNAGSVGAERAHTLVLSCRLLGEREVKLKVPLFAGDFQPVPLRLRVAWSPEDQALTCGLEQVGGDAIWDTAAGVALGGDLRLALTSGEAVAPGGLTTLRIDQLELRGVRPGAPSEDPLHRANLALLKGEPAEALALLPAEAIAERAVALASLRRPLEAVEALRAALGDSGSGAEAALPAMWRLHRELFAPLLRAATGEQEYARLFYRYWYAVLSGDRPTPAVQEALIAETSDLSFPEDLEDPAWRLLARRAVALLESGRRDRGQQASADWLAAYEGRAPPPESPLHFVASSVYRALALDAAERGERAAALDYARRYAERYPVPLVAADRLAVEPRWRESGLPLPDPAEE